MFKTIIRNFLAFVSLLCCLTGIWLVGRAGLTRTLTEYVLKANFIDPANAPSTLPAANMVVSLSPSDPEAHHARGIALSNTEQFDEAIQELERATSLRPRHYLLWMKLGSAREQNGDQQGAVAAFSESVRLAPLYAQPRWELGNALFRMGRAGEAFEEMRRSAASDPTLLPLLIDLAWGAYGDDAQSVLNAINPQTNSARMALARSFAKRGNTSESIKLFRASGGASAAERRSLISELINSKRFAEAYKVWSSGQNNVESKSGTATINDPGFEGRISFNDPGFGWQPRPANQTLNVSLDTENPHGGAQALRLHWSGDSNPSTPALTQLILVEPNKRYQLGFWGRTHEIVTGGLPLVVVKDANSSDGRVLGQSSMLSQGTSGWQHYVVDFSTADQATAILIVLQRQNCSSGPCPIFGRLWLDEFSLSNRP
jgi:Tfp pilus assembly protein PilF